VYFTDLVNLAGDIEDTLCRRGFARVNMGKDTNVSVSAEVGHGYFSYLGEIGS
jgi:hypothetical protein